MSSRSGGVQALLLYYLGTPAFALLDFAFHIPLRVALPDGGTRAAYYAIVFVLGVLCVRVPRAAPWVGMGESSLNLAILMLAVLLPIWSAPDALLAGGGVPGRDMLLGRVVNLAVGGAVMVLSFHRAQAAILEAAGS